MQMSKYFSVLSAAALLAGATNLHAETEAQARAREALRQKMLELDAQKPSAPPRTAPAKPVTPTSAPPPVEAAPRQPVVPLAAPAVPISTADDAAIARARAAMRQEIQNLNVQQQPAPRHAAPARPVVTTPAPPVTQPTPPPPVAPVVAPAPAAPLYTPPVAQDDAAIARARAAVRQETHDPAAPPPAPTVRGPGKAPRSGATVAFPEAPAPSVAPSIRSPEAPPSPVPATKELELAELLRKYRADEISPEDYHKQRAAILARP